MRADLRDLAHEDHEAHTLDPQSDAMQVQVMRALAFGLRERSPFLHACGVKAARGRWKERSPMSANGRVMVRIDVNALLASGQLLQEQFIDVSSQAAQRAYFRRLTLAAFSNKLGWGPGGLND